MRIMVVLMNFIQSHFKRFFIHKSCRQNQCEIEGAWVETMGIVSIVETFLEDSCKLDTEDSYVLKMF